MSDTRLTLRDHDSLWLFHRERLLNDWQLQKARRTGRNPVRARELVAFLDVHAVEADQKAATRVVGRIAQRLGANKADLDQVLDILGLTPETAVQAPRKTPKPPKPQGRRYGQCRTCQRAGIPLRTNGGLTAHSPTPDQTAAQNRCDGTNSRPAKNGVAA